MKKAISWMAQNHVAANLLMMVFIVGGMAMGISIKQEVFPEIDLDIIQVTVAYPGSTPEEVEEGIILKIEENIRGVDGIKEIKSTASEGLAVVNAEIEIGEDPDLILQDIKSEVDRITTFPKDAEKPVITKLTHKREVLSVVVYGNASERTLREQAEIIRDDLLSFPEISQIELSGVRPYEISIEIPEENLRSYNLTPEQVAERIRKASQDIPAGEIKTSGGEILVRTLEKRYFGKEYKDIVIIENSDGTEVRLDEIADVKETFEDVDIRARFDGMPAAMAIVFRVGDERPTEISNIVKKYVKDKKMGLSDGLQIAVWDDRSEMLKSRIKLLIKNAILGLILVAMLLGLFLQLRLSFWIMLAIPISFLGALFIMPLFDVSINMISLFAFIMALGIVVDDAIIVGENIFEHRRKGKSYLQAAIDGTIEVGIPVIFSVLTNIIAFIPLLFVTGTVGKFIRVMPIVVISIFFVSLLESLFILPSHLSPRGRKKKKEMLLFGGKFTNLLERFIKGPYSFLLRLCLDYHYTSIAVAVAVFFIFLGVIQGGIIKFKFLPEVEGDLITSELVMPVGTPFETTLKIAERIAKKGVEAAKLHSPSSNSSILRHIYVLCGSTIQGGGPGAGAPSKGAHIANVAMLLIPSEKRDVSAAQVAKTWRKIVGEIPGVDSLTFASSVIHVGADIDVALAHKDFEVLDQASLKLKEHLAGFSGVSDISDSYIPGKRELKIKLSSEARTFGVTEESLGRQIRGRFYGAEALRFQRGRDEVKVMVRYPEDGRESIYDFEKIRIRTPQGGELPLSEAAIIEEGRGYSEIRRTDQKRVVNVTATVDEKVVTPDEVLTELKVTILKELINDYPGLTYALEGEEKERRESVQSMMRGFIIALFGMFAILAIPLKRYTQPLLIMTAIPFGMIGAVTGHLIMGYNLSILSIFGIVAVSGVVVNDSLLLICRANENLRSGMTLYDALMEASQRRFRPILLTSLTTFFSLMPMILETSVQAKFLIPMAISLGFGVLFATGITLLLIPSLYMVLEDLRRIF